MISYFATAVVAVSLVAASPEPLQWESDYVKALKETRADHRPLLVVLEKPAEPEQRIDEKLLAKGQVAGEKVELLRPYQLCRVDVTSDYGERVAKAFGATKFPYTAIIDKTGSLIIYDYAGAVDAKKWEKTLLAYKEGTQGKHVASSDDDHGPYTVTVQKPVVTEGSSSSSYCPSCQRRGY